MLPNLKKELLNKPHLNWSPKKYPNWLILELEMDIIIRDIQVKVAQNMIEPKQNKSVIQLNMGEGNFNNLIN